MDKDTTIPTIQIKGTRLPRVRKFPDRSIKVRGKWMTISTTYYYKYGGLFTSLNLAITFRETLRQPSRIIRVIGYGGQQGYAVYIAYNSQNNNKEFKNGNLQGKDQAADH